MVEKKQNVGFIDIPISQIFPAPWNYKEAGSEEEKAVLANSMKRHGVIVSFIVREIENGYEMVNGNHRLELLNQMADELGHDMAHCYNLGPVTDTYAQEVALATNEIRFKSDMVKMSELMSNILADSGSLTAALTALPYKLSEVQNIARIKNFDWKELEKKKKEKKEEGDIISYNVKLSQETAEIFERLKDGMEGVKTASKAFEVLIMEAAKWEGKVDHPVE